MQHINFLSALVLIYILNEMRRLLLSNIPHINYLKNIEIFQVSITNNYTGCAFTFFILGQYMLIYVIKHFK